MKTSTEIRADVLKTLLIEDRQEIREIRSSLYNVIILLSTASFAITSFLLDKSIPQKTSTCLVTDGFIIFLLWVSFARLKRDLYCCRQCLLARQDLMKNLGTASEPEDCDPFPDARTRIPDVTDQELWFLPVLATAAILIKSIAIWLQVP